jgi:DNA-binding transcriptional ArsR family regulator
MVSIDLPQVKPDDRAGAQLDALGDRTRREIFALIARTPAAVGEIAEVLPIGRPAVSQHLKVLREAGLLSVHREGTRNIYSADPTGIAVLHAAVERFWRDALAAFKIRAEQKNAGES